MYLDRGVFACSMHPSQPKILAERGSDQHPFCSCGSKKSGSMRIVHKMNYQDATVHLSVCNELGAYRPGHEGLRLRYLSFERYTRTPFHDKLATEM